MADGPLVEVDDGVNSSGALLVSCFPSVGFVSSIVAHFLVEKLELELGGGVDATRFFQRRIIHVSHPTNFCSYFL